MTPTSSQFSASTWRSFAGTKPNNVQPAVAETGVKARMHSCPCELSIEMEPVDEVILLNKLFDDSGSVGL